MNCPSRTDDDLVHPGWNQNPPYLAFDLTTRQDLNGISNARELQDRAGLVGVSFAGWDEGGITAARDSGREKKRPDPQGASLTLSGRSISPISSHAAISGNKLSNNTHRTWQTAKEWALWLLSVAVASTVISHIRYPTSGAGIVNLEPPPRRLPERSTCEEGGANGDEYNLPLHVAGLFIILFVSTLACAFPILAVWFPRLRIPPSFLFFVTHFGTGVLIATAFVHLLPTAFTSLGDQCLSKFWTTDYPAMPGAIALGGIFLVTVIEMVFSPARHCCRPPTEPVRQSSPQVPRIDITEPPNSAANPRAPAAMLDGRHLSDLGPLVGRSSSMSRSIKGMGEDHEGISRVPSAPEQSPQGWEERKTEAVEQDVERSDDDTLSLSPELQDRKSVMQVFLLEMGILFHSVFIGMSLSVSVGNTFVILLIAIVFHQSFEGLALGARIASLNWPRKAYQPWVMSLAYGCTTPLGQAIGLATHTLYSPNSEVGLLLVGTMNAISAGLLIFASLVELMSEDFLSDESWKVLRGKKRVIACILVFLGAFCMSLVGAWA